MKKTLLLLIAITLFCNVFSEELDIKDNEKLLGILYHQISAEYKALCYQAYNLATIQLLQYDLKGLKKPPAVIVDVDETVLGNSRYNAREMLGIAEYPQGFYDWLESMESEPVAGALEFLRFADSLGVNIFYITNRSHHAHEATVGNLKKYHFPQAFPEQVLCKEKQSSKEPRRMQVAEDYEVLLLIGDNLIDFSHEFEVRDIDERLSAVDQLKIEFGRRFIILPNFMHGFWIKQLNDFRYDMSEEEKKEFKLRLLKY